MRKNPRSCIKTVQNKKIKPEPVHRYGERFDFLHKVYQILIILFVVIYPEKYNIISYQ